MSVSAKASREDLRKEQQAQSQRQGGSWFTLGYKDAAAQWWACLSPAVTEHKVLSFVPYLQQPPTHTQTGSAPNSKVDLTSEEEDLTAQPVTSNSITDPYGPRRWSSTLVKLSGKGRALNEFSVERVGEEVENNLVMLHGYGAGLGFFYKNFEGLSRRPGWKVYALDMLGMGRSSRPAFRIHAKDRAGKITEAENWFIDALEEWRVERGLEKFTLLGHSMGGYMATAYALKYPGRLNKLILASPVGIPEDPYAVSADLPEPGDSSMQNEVLQDQSASVNGAPSAKPDAPRRQIPKWLSTLWDANVSPFSIVRWAGPLGPRLVSGWTSRRFSQMPEDEQQALHDYSYSLFRQRGSGEYALAYILAPGAFARSPLIRRIQGVGRQYLAAHSGPTVDPPSEASAARPRESGLSVVFMYGEHDWMDIAGGYAAEQKLKEEKEKATRGLSREERQKDQGEAKVVVIRKAGHHVYLDGWEQFNKEMEGEMKDVEQRTSKLRAWGLL